MWFEKEGKIFVSMPGVPHEMKGMMEDEVIASLKARFTLPHIAYRTLLTAGIGESYLAELIKDFETVLPENIRLAYLPNYGMVRLRLSTSGIDKNIVEKDVEHQFDILQKLVKEYLVTNEDEAIEAVVGKLLKAKGRTVSTAESCTGGYIAHLFTSMPGSSAFFDGSVVSYSNKVKEALLYVGHDTLEDHGAVSEEVAKQMIQGALQTIKTDYAIAVSGIMGPDGGTTEKPVGTVWIAVGNAEKTITKKLHFRFDRIRNIQLTAVNALNMLRQFILEN